MTLRKIPKVGDNKDLITAKDVRDGASKVTIVSLPKQVETKFGEKIICDIKLPNGQIKSWIINKTSGNYLIDEFGDDENQWIDKKVNLEVVKMLFGDSLKDVIYVKEAIPTN